VTFLTTSQINSELLRAFYRIYESYLRDRKGSLPILPLGQKFFGTGRQTNDSSMENFQRMIETIASKYLVDSNLIKAVVRTESNYLADAVSSNGDQSLMQYIISGRS
jgi:hypothetical protein